MQWVVDRPMRARSNSNFARPTGTTRDPGDGSGLADHFWRLAEIVALLHWGLMRPAIVWGLVWACIGLGIGFFWLIMAFIFFSGGGLLVTILFDYVAVIGCPPLFFGHNYFLAPFLNAPLYGAVAFVLVLARSRSRPQPDSSQP
jgi:hypothetical protein